MSEAATQQAPAPSQTVVLPGVQQQIATSLLGWLVVQDKLAVWSMISSGMMFAAAVYALFWVAPAQLQEIKKGYQEMQVMHVEERKATQIRHQEHFAEMITKVEAVTQAQSKLIEKLILRETEK